MVCFKQICYFQDSTKLILDIDSNLIKYGVKGVYKKFLLVFGQAGK